MRIGVALSDPLGVIASPHSIITRQGDTEADIQAILDIIGKSGAEHVVVGLPLSMDGTEGEQAAKTRGFAAELGKRTAIPVTYQDERLSTQEARRMVRENRKMSSRERIDAQAAALILQDYLNALNPVILGDEEESYPDQV